MTIEATPPKPHRLDSLDGLRGIAALLVLLFHYTARFPDFYPEALPPAFSLTFGYFGVHLFFLISGFVILMSLERNKGRGFLRSRFLRLYPLFWIAVAVTYIVRVAGPLIENTISPTEFVLNLTMLDSYIRIEAVDGVYWSLAYELGFYAFLYANFRLGFERFVPWLPVYMAAGAVLFVWLRPVIPHPLHYLLVFNAYGHLFAGGLALYLLRNKGRDWRWIGVLLAAPAIQVLYDGWAGGIAVGVSVALAYAATNLKTGLHVLTTRPLIWLGTISYALYLTHQMIGYELMARLQLMGAPWLLSVLLTTAMALGLAAVLTFWIERPLVSYLKAKVWPAPRPIAV